MEKAFYSAISRRFLGSPRLPYVIAMAFLILGIGETVLIYALHAEMVTMRETMRTRDWQVTEASE